MGIFGDNFYSWLDKQHAKEKETMDAAFKHPDGSECKASKVENCPYYRKSMSITEMTDNLDSNKGKDATPDEKEFRHLHELQRVLASKRYMKRVGEILGKTPTFGELEEAYNKLEEDMQNWKPSEETAVKDARKKRDAVYNSHKDDKEYNYASCSIETGEKVPMKSGWGVTFQTTSTEASGHENYLDDEAYDKKVSQMRDIFGSEPLVGIFEGLPEISFNCQDTLRAIAAMVMFEQKAIFGFKHGKDIVNKTFSKDANAIKRPQEK